MASKKKPKPNTINLKFSLSIGFPGVVQEGEAEYDREEWESYTEEEKQEQVMEWAYNYIETWFEEVEEDQ